ncbi:MAG TPA: nuclear transport factor 2 family protein [Candidatus Binataceae bacterium]|nr:nuclear transport factor 2 family protein [Candidatus Binataceae bacterium]
MRKGRLGWAALLTPLATLFQGIALPKIAHADCATEIKSIQLEIAAAAERRDLDAIMAPYIPGDKLFVFDMYPPQAYIGWDAFRGDWKNFIDGLKGPISYKLTYLTASCDDDFGYTHMLQIIRGTRQNGRPFVLNLRETDVYRKVDGKWRIVHVHTSVPVDLKTEQGDFVTKWRQKN